MSKNAFDAEQGNTAEELLGRIGQLTRQLREGLRELGLDKEVAKAAQAIPDARDRLAYVAATTERAAHRALNAIDVAQPLQEGLASEAKGLSKRWDEWFANPIELDHARELVMDTRGYLQDVPQKANAINSQLMEILMAQDFQDLTGQVISRITGIAQNLEKQLVQVLVDFAPSEIKRELDNGLLNGPQINPEGNSEVVADQGQVDDLLDSLGF